MIVDAATGIATSAPRIPPRVPPATAAITTTAPGTETARFMMRGLKKYASTFKPLQLFTVQELFGSLGEAQKVHFNDGGQFDKLYTPGGK